MLKFGLNKKQIGILEEVFKKYPSVEKVLIFGSRSTGKYKTYSDIDVCLYGKIDDLELSKINEDLVESNLIYKVDLVVFQNITNEKLKENILKDGIVFGG